MKISYKTDYALKVILDLANNYPDKLVHIEDIAKRRDSPKKFLEQILLERKKGDFARSKKGPYGGYQLIREPKDIILGDVIRFIEGSVYPISCVDPDAQKTCEETKQCVFYSIWYDVGKKISSIIDNVNFEQLKERDARLRQNEAGVYYI